MSRGADVDLLTDPRGVDAVDADLLTDPEVWRPKKTQKKEPKEADVEGVVETKRSKSKVWRDVESLVSKKKAQKPRLPRAEKSSQSSRPRRWFTQLWYYVKIA